MPLENILALLAKMKKLLVICGPTATGKTSLALHLAKVFNTELVSVDSRQVYKDMDIGTGKDLPINTRFKISDLRFKNEKIGYYEVESIKVWGYDLVDPKEEFSVSDYIKIAENIIKNIWDRGKLPILVGGTGFYIKGIVDGIATSQIPKNKRLRKLLNEKSADELYKILKQHDVSKAGSMNPSDRKNPRRLIRAIEVAQHKSKKLKGNVSSMTNDNLRPRINRPGSDNILFIGLTAAKEYLNERIEKRVGERLKQGLEKEIVNLIKKGVGWDTQAMQSLGYKQWQECFKKCHDFGYERRITEGTEEKFEGTERQRAIEEWKKAEKQYAKRQMTWFKKDKRIKWFDISGKNWKKDVEMMFVKWHNDEYNAEKN